MKVLMRPQKTQIGSLIRAPLGLSVFKRDLYIMMGYTTIDVMCVGGAGGYAGDSASNSRVAECGAGGGGGGSIRRRFRLQDLSASVNVSVGIAGGGGSKGSDGVAGGNGNPGGDSYFGVYRAYGGQGGQGGLVQFRGGHQVNDYVNPSIGGAGGGNTDLLGSGGAGGVNGYYVGNPTQVRVGPTNGASGTYVDTGNGNGGGKGGGGGFGMFRWNSLTDSGPANGGQGAVSAASSYGSVGSGFTGGVGGGANVASITGINEYYGHAEGAVVMRLS